MTVFSIVLEKNMTDFESAKASLYQAMMKKPYSQEDYAKLIKALDEMYKVAGAR